MHILEKIGLVLFVTALVIFTMSLGMDGYTYYGKNLEVKNEYHREVIDNIAQERDFEGKRVLSNIEYIRTLSSIFSEAQKRLDSNASSGIPEGISEWEYRMSKEDIKNYKLQMVQASSNGLVSNHKILFFSLTILLGIIGGILYIIPKFLSIAGIKNNHIYHRSMQRGLKVNVRKLFLYLTIAGILIYGIYYMNYDLIWPGITLLLIGTIVYLVYYKRTAQKLDPSRSASPEVTGWLGIITGIYLISFYILLYWIPEYIVSWIQIVDPVSRFISGNPASRWFLYGFLYTVIVLVMGVRMIAKYRHNRYQIIRTLSVMFFQTCFAFILPEIMSRLNMPAMDLKNIWPLNYSFFFDYNIDYLISSGGFGIFLLVWGIILTIIAVPVITYFYGKRWYCSWVCGCGGLAETLGDPYRQLSDKSLRAWKYERYIIHGVLVFAVTMTLLVLYTYFSGSSRILWIIDSYSVRAWYGFLIGSAFAGVIGTGFYPLMGNRVWCRFGCPLAAYLGLVQKFKSRFRITTNGGQCISCGNCSTYCEMGIDVRWYAQRGQDIVRSSCVGCGVCSAVCPRGVLRLENSSVDINERASHTRTIHISEDEVKLLY